MLFSPFAAIALGGLAMHVAATGSGGHRSITRRVHERQPSHWNQDWAKGERISAKAVLPVRIGLTQSNLDEGHDKLMDISNPRSPNYGKHMSAHEVIDFFAPKPASVQAVQDWLVGAGIKASEIGVSINKQWIQMDLTADRLEELLSAEYHVWEHYSGATDIASEKYYLPQEVQKHVDYITPGIRLRESGKQGKKAGLERRGAHLSHQGRKQATLPGLPNLNATTCNKYVTAACTRAQYRIPRGSKAHPGNELGIYESEGDHYSKVDLDIYWHSLESYIPNGTYPEERLIDGAVGASETVAEIQPVVGVESDLDFQTAWPLLWPQKTVLFQDNDEWYEIEQDRDGTPFVGSWNTFYDAIDGSYCTFSAFGETGDCTAAECKDPVYPDPNPGGYKGALQCGVYKPTSVISMSYATGENNLPAYYLKRQCAEIMKLALQGVTVVASSGDGGVGGLENCPGTHHQIFHPLFPSSCPYTLSVGSTELNNRNTTKTGCVPRLDEVPTSRFGSGGGFSNVFPTPEHQANVVKHYLDTAPLNFTGYTQFVDGNDFSNVTSGLFHIGGRGAPDVAAIGDRYLVVSNKTWYTVGGTSVSAPIWGAILTLLNEERLAAGKSTLGFVHPLLYANPDAFHDITTGFNPGCNLSYSNGFPAIKGWDPVSGLGSPIYPKLRKALLEA